MELTTAISKSVKINDFIDGVYDIVQSGGKLQLNALSETADI